MFMSGDLRYLLLSYDTLVVILYLVLFFYYQDTNNFCSATWKHENRPLYFRSFHLKVGIGFLIGTQRPEGKTEFYKYLSFLKMQHASRRALTFD